MAVIKKDADRVCLAPGGADLWKADIAIFACTTLLRERLGASGRFADIRSRAWNSKYAS